MIDKGRTMKRAGILACWFPFLITFIIAIFMIPGIQPGSNFLDLYIAFLFLSFTYIPISPIFIVIGLVLMHVSKKYEEKNKRIYKKSSNSNAYIGLLIIIISLLVFFLLPLDVFLGLPKSTLGSLKTLGIQTSFTLYSLFSICQTPGVSMMFSQCGIVMFFSICIFILIAIGFILFIKGLTKRNEIRLIHTENAPEMKEMLPEDHSLKTLKMRYARGEITRKQYLQMKKDLED